MLYAFYIASAVAVISTLGVITGRHAVHALLYFIISLLAVAMIFLLFGAHFAAALEVIIYAGAIMVLFVFVMMMLNPGPRSVRKERHWLSPGTWACPAVLALILTAELIFLLASGTVGFHDGTAVTPREVGMALFGPYLLGVELVSILLLAGLVGAYHLAWRLGVSRADGAGEGRQS